MALKSHAILAASLALVLWLIPPRAASVDAVIRALDAAINLSPGLQSSADQFKRLGKQLSVLVWFSEGGIACHV